MYLFVLEQRESSQMRDPPKLNHSSLTLHQLPEASFSRYVDNMHLSDM